MSYFELYQENPSLFLIVLLISFIMTIFVYGAFPLIFAKTTKKPITKKKYKRLCYGLNIIGMACFIVLNGAASGGPYLLWTWIFSNCGLKILNSRGLLKDNEQPNGLNNGELENNSCESVEESAEKFQQNSDLDIDKISPEAAEYIVAEQLGEKYMPKGKLNHLPFYHIIAVILSALSILSIIIAMNVQDADRNIYEPLNPTVLYFILIGVNIVFSAILFFLKEHSILKGFVAFVPALFSILTLTEGSLFSNGYGYYNSYLYNDLVNVFNAIWVSLSFLIFLMNLIPLTLALRSKWHHTIKYREKCYMRVAKMKEYLNNGIISQEEFEKNKIEILKNIEM